MKFKILILSFTMLHFYSCKELNKDAMKDAYVNNVAVDTINNSKPMTNNPCLECDMIYKNFPKDSSGFEKLYGYPNGIRQEQAYDDVQLIFKCIKECYDRDNLIKLIELSASIKYDADGPTYLQSNLHEYISGNKELISDIYGEIKCDIFKRHLKFLLEGIDTNSTKDLIGIFNTLNIKDSCKRKSIKDTPKMISHDH